MCLGKRLEVNIYMHILLFFTNPLLQPKIKRIRFDPGLGSHLHAFGPKSWPKRIGNRPFPPSSSPFLLLPPFPLFSSHWWEFFFLKILTSGKYFFLTSGMNFLSHWWEFNFFPLVRKKSFPLVRIPHFLSSYSWNIEMKLSTHINGLIVIAYKLLDDPHWHFLIG